MRQRRRRDDGRIGDLDAVMDFVALLESAQDGDGVFHRGLVHQHFLEAPLERRVLFDVLAVLIERGRADAMQLAARQRGLEHVAGVHGALGLAGAHHGVQFIDEQNHLAFLFRQIGEDRLQALLELAAKFRAGDQRAHVERENALVAQAFRHLAVDDALCEALDDGGLADAGLPDEHRIVLGPALQNLNGAPDLVIAADDRIEFALARALGEIDAVLLQRLAVLLGARILHLGAAANFLDRLFQAVPRRAAGLQDTAEFAAVIAGREHEQLAGDELIAALLGELVGDIQQFIEVVAEQHLAARSFHLRGTIQRGREF